MRGCPRAQLLHDRDFAPRWRRSTPTSAGHPRRAGERSEAGELLAARAEMAPASVGAPKEDGAGRSAGARCSPIRCALNPRRSMSPTSSGASDEGHPRAWIFTSATLAVGKDSATTGASWVFGEAESACWDSPSTTAKPGRALRAEGMPDRTARTTPRPCRRCLSGARRQRRRAFFLPAARHAHPCRTVAGQARGRRPRTRCCCRRGQQGRTAGTLPPPRATPSWSAARASGKGGRARRGAVAGGHRQAAVRPPDDPVLSRASSR